MEILTNEQIELRNSDPQYQFAKKTLDELKKRNDVEMNNTKLVICCIHFWTWFGIRIKPANEEAMHSRKIILRNVNGYICSFAG